MMAWLSVGTSNEDLCAKLVEHRVLRSGPLLDAFLGTDRGDFVQPEDRAAAYLDRPFKRGAIHLSAPHMYVTVLEALSPEPGVSFLNIGSGSGYLSCLFASIVGLDTVNHGIEVSPAAVVHSQECIRKWLTKKRFAGTQGISVVQGNCFDLDVRHSLRYDRIYVGAGCPDARKEFFFSLLSDNGILVMPIDDRNEMIKVQKICGRVFHSHVVSHVHFAPLVLPDGMQEAPHFNGSNGVHVAGEGEEAILRRITETDARELVIVDHLPPSPSSPSSQSVSLPPVTWAPEKWRHMLFPPQFRQVVTMLLLASNRSPNHVKGRRAMCGLLPMTLWYHILSFATRDWFVVDDPIVRLRAELLAERMLRQRAEDRFHAAETARRAAERERDLYRMIMLRSRRAQARADFYGDDDEEEEDDDEEAEEEEEEEEEEDEFLEMIGTAAAQHAVGVGIQAADGMQHANVGDETASQVTVLLPPPVSLQESSHNGNDNGNTNANSDGDGSDGSDSDAMETDGEEDHTALPSSHFPSSSLLGLPDAIPAGLSSPPSAPPLPPLTSSLFEVVVNDHSYAPPPEPVLHPELSSTSQAYTDVAWSFDSHTTAEARSLSTSSTDFLRFDKP